MGQKKMRTKRAVIVQCRLSSSRLPGKALKELGNKPVLAWVLASMKKVKADKYFVATDQESYESLKPICKQNGFDCFAGDLNDVLKRFCDLIKTLKVDTIIRATADNPFLFYEAAEASVEEFESRRKSQHPCDYFTYTGLPHGSGVEIFSAQSLLKAAEEEMTEPIRKKLNAAIHDVGIEHGYECIINTDINVYPFVHQAVSEDATPFVEEKIMPKK